jgi:2-methylcitrate dehydratase PrpD
MHPDILALLGRIEFQSRANLELHISADAVPAEVTVHARGKVFSLKVLVPSDDPRNPMTTQERREKFLGCLAGIYSAEAARRMFDNFERLEDFSSLTGLAQPANASLITHN